MLRRRTGWIGIDIGSRSIKVAQVERDPEGRLRVRQAVIIGRETPWLDSDSPAGSPAGASGLEVVAALSYGDRFAGTRAACALPMHLYGFRGLHIPHGSLDERRSMLRGALHDLWTESGEACEFDFWDTDLPGRKARQDEPNVNVLAVPRRWTRRLTEDAAHAELRLQVLDGPPLAIARAVQLCSPTPEKSPSLAIDWGFTSTTLCVVLNGRAVYTRRVRSCGLRLVCDSIQETLGVSLEETQHLLLSYGLPVGASDRKRHPLQRMLLNAATEHLDRFSEEIRRTLAYFRAQRRELIPERIWLMGGGASVAGAAPWLSSACETPVETWKLPAAETDGPASTGSGPGREPAFSQPMLAIAIALSALPLAEETE